MTKNHMKELYQAALNDLETASSVLVVGAALPTRKVTERAKELARSACAKLEQLDSLAAGNNPPKIGE